MKETTEKIYYCSICGRSLGSREYGPGTNNAAPINDGRCCDSCNQIVITRRINDINRKFHYEKNKQTQ